MAKLVKEEKVVLKKGKAFFNLTGVAKITDYSLKLNEVSELSGYKYSRLNLGIETRAGNVVYAEAMGGFSTKKENKIYVASKEDITNMYTIDWEDREDKRVLETIHPSKFIKIGIETYKDKEDDKEKTFVKKFLSWYDAIQYVSEHVEDGMVLNVRGVLKYSVYKDKVQIKKEINSIFLAKENDEYKATFVQTILLDKDSVGKLDTESNEYPVYAKVIDYAKMWGDKEVKTNIPYTVDFSIKAENEKMTNEQVKKFLTRFLKVKKGIAELSVEGDIVEGTPMGEVTVDDLTDEMKELIDLGLYTKEDILAKHVVKGDRVSKLIITKPYVQQIEKDGEKRVQFFHTEERYKEEDLILDFMYESDDEVKESEEVITEDSSDNWLEELN